MINPSAPTAIAARETDAIKLRRPLAHSPCAQWFSLELARHVSGSFVRLNSILPSLSDLEEATWDEYLRGESARSQPASTQRLLGTIAAAPP